MGARAAPRPPAAAPAPAARRAPAARPPPRPAVPSPRLPPARRAAAAPATPAVAPKPGAGVPGARRYPGVVEIPGEKEFNSCKKLPPGKRIVRLNLKPDTEVMDLIGWISSITCAQFIVSVPVQGKKLTIISPQLITPEEAYRLFFSALDSRRAHRRADGQVPARGRERARRASPRCPSSGPTRRRRTTAATSPSWCACSTSTPQDLTNNVLNRIKTETGDIIAYRIVAHHHRPVGQHRPHGRDHQAVRHAIGQPRPDLGDPREEHVGARHGVAHRRDRAGAATSAPGSGGRAAPPPAQPKPQPGPPGELSTEMSITKLIPDERTNSLIVVANKRAHDWLVALVHKLDVPLEEAGRGSEGRFHVYYCANANCDELAATLSAITGVQISGSLGHRPPRRPGRRPGRARRARPGQTSPTALLFESDIRISFDAPTNSLLIMSTFKDYQSLRKVIEQLDSPRKQIFIEATIMEVLLDKTRTVGRLLPRRHGRERRRPAVAAHGRLQRQPDHEPDRPWSTTWAASAPRCSGRPPASWATAPCSRDCPSTSRRSACSCSSCRPTTTSTSCPIRTSSS